MIVWTNGCFDILQAGHVQMLEFAKRQGDKLVVGLDTDQRVSNNKGPGRPYNHLLDRMRVIRALRCVDDVVSFGSDEELLMEIEKSGADLIVVGREYEHRVIGSDLAPVRFFDRIPGHSSTRLINALRV